MHTITAVPETAATAAPAETTATEGSAQNEPTPLGAPEAASEAVSEAAPARRLSPIAQRLFAARAKLRVHLAASMQHATLWPYAAVLSPVVVISILAPVWLSFVMGVLGLVALDKVAPSLEPRLWAVNGRRGFLAYVLPLQLLGVLWFFALVALGHVQQAPSTVFPYLAVLCVAVAPAGRWQRERATRRLPLRLSLRLVSALAIAVHGLAALGSLGVV
jgi:hypothetical protein